MGILTGRARTRALLIIGGLAITLLFYGVAFASHGEDVVDMTYAGAEEIHNGGVFVQGGAGAGTGNWDPFLTIQSNQPTEQGYNTIKAEGEFDTFFGGGRTHPLSAAAVPAIDYDGGKYREFGLDANDQGADTWMSIDTLQVFLTTRPDVGAFDPVTGTFGNDADAQKIYDNGSEPILMLSQGLESGSGVSDISLLLPDSRFPCEYGAPDCDSWIVLYTHYGAATFNPGEVAIGESGENDAANYEWDVSAGFEEWSTQLVPVVFVEKTAEASFTRTYEWEITKDVDPAEVNLFAGQSASFDYDVEVTQTVTDSAFMVTGTVTITNPTGGDVISDKIPAEITSITDELAGYGPVDLDCPGFSPGDTLGAGDTLECTYMISGDPLDAEFIGENVATVTLDFDGILFEYDGSAMVDFTDVEPTIIGYPEINVTDTNGGLGGAAGDFLWEYSVQQTCSSDPLDYRDGTYRFTHDNTATIDETGQNDSETVTVNCFAPVVSKDAVGSYDELHEWDISKSVDPSSQWGFAGELLDWEWTVGLSETLSEDNFSVTGDIVVHNAAPMEMLVSLSDELNDAAATPGVISSCAGGIYGLGLLTIPAGGTATCAYEAVPAGRTATLNTATATLNLIDFDATADVSFEVTVHDGEAVVDDDQDLDLPETVSAGEGPWGWTEAYDHTCSSDFADYGSDGMYSATINNLATVTGSDGDYDEASASTTYTCYAPVVDKTAVGSYDEFHEWDISKSVDPSSQWGFAGELLDWEWTVGLSETLSEDNFSVTGSIGVFNAAPDSMTVTLTDVLDDGTAATITGCSGVDVVFADPSLTIPAGGTATCAYEAVPAGRTATLNTATATLNLIDFDATADVSFEVTVHDGEAVVDDDQDLDLPETVSAGEGPWGWTEAYDHTCSSDFADYGSDGMYSATINNLATVTGSDGDYDEASASTTYTCYAPVVDKDADTEWFRDYTWDITKDWDGSYSLNAGESVTHDYEVTVNQYVNDHGYRAFGSISVYNAALGPMSVLLSDSLSDGTPVTITGCSGVDVVFADPSLTIPAGGTATCAYSVGLPDDTDLTNWATAALNGIPFSASAAIDFSDPIVSGYPSVNVDDTNGLSWLTSTSNAWAYAKTFTCPTDASLYRDGVYTITHPNTATIRQTGQSDDALVTVECSFPWEGLTPGYWKNHLDDWVGYAPTDLVKSVFEIPGTYMRDLGNATLLEALKWPAGDEVEEKAQVLLHHATAAVLNAAHPNVAYPVSEAWIVDQVNLALASGDPNVMLALKDQLDMYNNYGADIHS